MHAWVCELHHFSRDASCFSMIIHTHMASQSKDTSTQCGGYLVHTEIKMQTKRQITQKEKNAGKSNCRGMKFPFITLFLFLT